MGRLERFFAGTPAPVPPEQLGPFDSEQDAQAAARAADMKYAAYLDARKGFMEPVQQGTAWIVVRRGMDRPSWMRVGP